MEEEFFGTAVGGRLAVRVDRRVVRVAVLRVREAREVERRLDHGPEGGQVRRDLVVRDGRVVDLTLRRAHDLRTVLRDGLERHDLHVAAAARDLRARVAVGGAVEHEEPRFRTRRRRRHRLEVVRAVRAERRVLEDRRRRDRLSLVGLLDFDETTERGDDAVLVLLELERQVQILELQRVALDQQQIVVADPVDAFPVTEKSRIVRRTRQSEGRGAV